MVTRLEQESIFRQPFSREWFDELGQSLAVMRRVVMAIMLRESRTRYGASNLGYVWALIDPVIQLLIWLAVFSALGRTSPIAVPVSVFMLSGIVPFFFWRGAFARSASAVGANIGLISYPQVMPGDVVIARTILEACTTVVVFFVITTFLFIIFEIPMGLYFDDPADLILALGSLFYFALSIGFLSSGLGRVLPVWTNIQGYISRPLYILSGVFFTLEQLPTTVRGFMAYNPVAHQIEWIRSAAFESFDSSSYSVTFIFFSATIALLIGLIIDRILLLTGDEEIVS